MDIESAILNGRHEELLQLDELTTLFQNSTPPLNSFMEHAFSFIPTYKFNKGTSQYDMKRVPSWCDRVLIKNSKALRIIKYESVHIQYSDHMPIFALMSLQFHKITKAIKESASVPTIAVKPAVEKQTLKPLEHAELKKPKSRDSLIRNEVQIDKKGELDDAQVEYLRHTLIDLDVSSTHNPEKELKVVPDYLDHSIITAQILRPENPVWGKLHELYKKEDATKKCEEAKLPKM